jgi:hypothetical protein
MFTSSRFAKKSVEGVVTSANSFVARHLTIGLDTMLKAEEFPASVSNLNAGLSEVKAESLTHPVIGVPRKLFSSSAGGADNKSAVRNGKQRPTA